MKTSTVQEKFDQAPEKIQNIVLSVETSDALYEIEKKYDIYKEENNLRVLPKETTDVLIGLTHPKDFVPNLEKSFSIPKEKAREIAKEVNEKIFSLVKDLLIEIHGLKKTPQQAKEVSVTEKELLREEKSPLIPKPPQKKEESVIHAVSPPVPEPPKKPEAVDKPLVVPKPPKKAGEVGETEPSSAKGSGETKPTVTKDSGEAKQNIKNPFEEKLKQTFTIPKKNLAQTPTPIKQQDPAVREKKAAIQKDPYLETIE